MTRILPLAAVLVTALALPAIAGDTATKATSEAPAATASAAAGNPFPMETAHKHLVQLGYTNVSELMKDANGKWVGSADKDGKTVIVAVDVKGNVAN
jgi:hypothetical protein